MLLLLKRHERSEVPFFVFDFAFWGLGQAPTSPQGSFFEVREKGDDVCAGLMLFKLCFFSDFSRSFVKNCPSTEQSEVKTFER